MVLIYWSNGISRDLPWPMLFRKFDYSPDKDQEPFAYLSVESLAQKLFALC